MNVHKSLKSIDSIETYAYGTNEDLLCKKEETNYDDDDVAKENINKHNPNWLLIPDHPYGILIIAHSGLGKTTAFLNLTNHKMYTDKIYLYPKDPFEAKYQIAKYQSKQKTQHIVCI